MRTYMKIMGSPRTSKVFEVLFYLLAVLNFILIFAANGNVSHTILNITFTVSFIFAGINERRLRYAQRLLDDALDVSTKATGTLNSIEEFKKEYGPRI